MTEPNITEFASHIGTLVARQRIAEAFAELLNAARARSSWQLADRIQRSEQAYSYLLRYMVEGVEDPQRAIIYDGIRRELLVIRDLLIREMSLADTPTIYYNTLRSVNSYAGESLQSLTGSIRDTLDAMSPFNAAAAGTSAPKAGRRRLEMLQTDLFNRIWTSFPILADDAAILDRFIAGDDIPASIRSLAVSAMTLGLLQFFDDRMMQSLLLACRASDPRIAVRAVTGVVLVFDRHRDIALSPDSSAILESLKESPEWHRDLHNVIVELIRTTDTRRISAKLNEEVFPRIKKMEREMSDLLKDPAALADTSGPEGNPEWERIMSDPSVRDTLKELTDLQQEGADVFMATFSSLKQFPFFNDAANWFLPYDPDHSVLTPAAEAPHPAVTPAIAAMIAAAPFICDSDKYSMAISMSMMPDAQKSAIASQLRSHTDDLASMMSSASELASRVDRRAETNSYIHSLYRFYNLFRRKGDFYNPFAHVANPTDIPLLADGFDTPEALMPLAEFYFKVGLYDSAARIYSRLDDISEPDASRSQKLGFCYQKLGRLDDAASHYERADLLDGSDAWTLRHLVSVYRSLGQYSAALSAATRLRSLLGEDYTVLVTIGQLHILSGNPRPAVDTLRKAQSLDPAASRHLRPLAWALFLTGDLDGAAGVTDAILALSPGAGDLLNAGHIALARNRIPEAINYYRLSVEQSSLDTLIQSFRNDAPHLTSAGIPPDIVPLVIDAVTYSIR